MAENGGNQLNDCFVRVLPLVQNDKINILSEYFKFKYNDNPTFVVRVPGRVNLIGEHIDYCGYPVMPMALEQDILLAVKLNTDVSLKISNVNSKYKDFSTNIDNMTIKQGDSGGPEWYNYVLCGIRGAVEALPGKIPLKGASIAISGNILPASGLSSSSALVSAAALAILHGHGVQLTKNEMASICARCERYIGTEGGGMDQAIAFLAVKGCAQYITWDPVRAMSISLPSDAAFVVAHSLVEANKAATSDFNQRVTECRLATKVIASKTGIYEQLQKFTFFELQQQLQNTTDDMINLVKIHLKPEPYSRDDLCAALQLTKEELNEKHVTSNVKHVSEFKLYQRALHVFEEAIRVESFKNACLEWETRHKKIGNQADDGSNELNCGLPTFDKSDGYQNGADPGFISSNGIHTNYDYIKKLGKLMRESHKSLQNSYECSHPNLDRLVELSDEFGAYARLTGAGWGGCIVALCPVNRTQEYVSMLREKFYNTRIMNDRDISSLVFVTTPKQGAEILLT